MDQGERETLFVESKEKLIDRIAGLQEQVDVLAQDRADREALVENASSMSAELAMLRESARVDPNLALFLKVMDDEKAWPKEEGVETALASSILALRCSSSDPGERTRKAARVAYAAFMEAEEATRKAEVDREKRRGMTPAGGNGS